MALGSIYQDMVVLADNGHSADPSTSDLTSPLATPSRRADVYGDAQASQVQSRHNTIRQSGMGDYGDGLGMLPPLRPVAAPLPTLSLIVNEFLDTNVPHDSIFKTLSSNNMIDNNGDNQHNAFQCAMEIWDIDPETQPFPFNQTDWCLDNRKDTMAWQQYDWNSSIGDLIHTV